MNVPAPIIARYNYSLLRMLRLMSVDVLAIITSVVTSYLVLLSWNTLIGHEYVTLQKLFDERILSFSTVSILVISYFLFQKHYHMRTPFWLETKTVITAAFLALLLEGFFIYSNKADVSRAAVFTTWFFTPFLVMWIRSLIRHAQGNSGMSKVTIFGNQNETNRAKLVLESDSHMGICVLEISTEYNSEKAFDIMNANGSDNAIVALSGADGDQILLISHLRKKGINVSVLPPAMGMSASMDVHYILGMDAMFLVTRPETIPHLSRLAKRIFDIVFASIILCVLFLPIGIVSFIISLDGGLPIFRHKRIGKSGKKFGCLKFRSMHSNSDEILEKYLSNNPSSKREWEDNQKLVNDPRITKFGHIIRKTSIDEFPQLINVIKGDMSLIGPRPVTEKELSHYAEHAELYTAVKPGMTGLWQVSGRSNLSYEQRVSLDAWYVNNWSPWHDLIILAKTLPVVLKRSGAH